MISESMKFALFDFLVECVTRRLLCTESDTHVASYNEVSNRSNSGSSADEKAINNMSMS